MYISKQQFNSLKPGDRIFISETERIVHENKRGYLTINRLKGLRTVLYDGDVRKNVYVIDGIGVCYVYADLYKKIEEVKRNFDGYAFRIRFGWYIQKKWMLGNR